MASKKVILCPNPFRDERLAAAKRSKEILENVGLQTVVCLPFNREGYGEELGVPIRPLQQEIKSADLLIAFGGDGTILHLARTVALHRVPVLGINLGSRPAARPEGLELHRRVAYDARRERGARRAHRV